MRPVLTLLVVVFAAWILATEATFSCARGYSYQFADPYDCHMFYQCDFWGRRTRLSCPAGKVFDNRFNTCRHEWQAAVGCTKLQSNNGLKTQLVTFVKSLKIEKHFGLLANSKPVKLESYKAQGLVSGGSLVSFVHKLTGQNKRDVLDSTSLAAQAADHKYDRYEDTENWYKFYLLVMEKVGWDVQGFKFKKYTSQESSFKISKVVLDFLSAILAEDAELLSVVRLTIASLANSPDGLEVYGKKSSSNEAGNFQIIPCTVGENGQVNIAFVGSHFKSKSSHHNYFFFTWNKQSIDLFTDTQTMTLNEDVYSNVRKAVQEKLGRNAFDFVKDLDISQKGFIF